MTVPENANRGLLRVLGMAFSLAVAIGATVGGGIMRMPGEVAAHLPSKDFFIAAWILGGVNALLGVTVFAELGAMMPRSGGLYNFARRAFGSYAGFLVGYNDWLIQTVSVSLLALVVGDYSCGLLPGLDGTAQYIGLFILVALAAAQWTGIRSGSRIQELTTLLKTGALLGLLVACFVSIPRSMFISACLIMFIYLLINIAFLRILPVQQMAKDSFVAASVVKSLFGRQGELILRITMILSILGTMNAVIMTSTRVLHGLGRDGLFPHQATRVSAGGTPTLALALSALASCAFLLTGTFEKVLAAGGLFLAVNYSLSYAALFALRWREPNALRPYRAWGYPWTTTGAIILILVFFVGTIADDTTHSLVTLAVLAVTAPFYLIWRRFAFRRKEITGSGDQTADT